MSDFHTLTGVANHFGCQPRKISVLARAHGIGLDLGGRAGYRFTDTDIRQLAELMRVKPMPRRDKRKRLRT